MSNLRTPGPTPVPPTVLAAMAQPMINHRGPEFAALIGGVTAKLKHFFQTENDLLILTGSGTGGLEAAVVNLLSPGDQVLAVSIGVFGDRFAEIARVFGAQVTKLDFPWGQPADPAAIQAQLAAHPQIKAVLVTHNETSTGVTNDLESISQAVRGFDKLLVVDAISSVGSLDLPADRWGCDMVIGGSQKGWMVPPGLVFVTVSPKAWQAATQARMPRFYWDLASAKRTLERGQTPATPAVSILYGLVESLRLMMEEGLPGIVERHRQVAERCRQGAKALGLELFARPGYESNTVTAVKVPSGVDAKALLKALREKHDIVLAGGQASLSGKIFRIGHLGYVYEEDIDEVLAALREELPAATK